MKTIYIFRHGKTNFNILGIRSGISDAILEKDGVEEAKILGKSLKDSKIEHIYSSYLNRAIKTATIVSEELKNKVDIEIFNGLEEINMGDEEGKDPANIGKENRELLKARDGDYKFSNGESKYECRKRFYKTVKKLCEISPYDVFAISSHFFTIKQLLIHLNYENYDDIGNCEYVKLEFNNNNLEVLYRSSEL